MTGMHAKTSDVDRRYMAAHEALWRNAAAERAAGIGWETPEYLRLSHEAAEAAWDVHLWRQFALNRRVMVKLARQGVRV